jgi:hypothetical protein
MIKSHAFNLVGAARKPLIEALESFTNIKGVYQKAPKFGYVFYGLGTLDKEGTLHFDCDLQVVMDCVTYLEDCGFACESDINEEDKAPSFMELPMTESEELGLGRERRENPLGERGMSESECPERFTYQAEYNDPDCPDRLETFTAEHDEDAVRLAREYTDENVTLRELLRLDTDYNIIETVDLGPEPTTFTVEVPLAGFTPQKLDNLHRMVKAKAPLLKAAFGTADLTIRQSDEDGGKLAFPWCDLGDETAPDHGDKVKAYSTFVSLLCKKAQEKTRVTAKERDVDGNPKYTMRCWLLSLGFIGGEHKTSRKILLSNLSGNGAFKSGERRQPTEASV